MEMHALMLFALVGVAWGSIFSPIPKLPKPHILEEVPPKIKDDLQALKTPVDEAISYIGSKKCAKVKKIVGVAYEQLDGEKEPDLDKLRLELRTNSSWTYFDISTAAKDIIASNQVNKDGELVIFIHGFIDDPQLFAFKTVSNAFLKEDKAILALDCSSLIRWLYLRSTTYVRFIGEKLGEVLANMVKYGLNARDIHLIGHSLGSHISGFTGKTFYNLTGKQIGRISGLDPAGPCFSEVEPNLRLSSSDAKFVDVMHTNGGVYGMTEPLGHVDFFPNSGAKQPNCLTQICSHCRAWVYYAESVLHPRAFPAIKCSGWDGYRYGNCENEISFMGYATSSSVRGQYYLRSNDRSPYGLGIRGLVYEGDRGIINNLFTKTEDVVDEIDNKLNSD